MTAACNRRTLLAIAIGAGTLMALALPLTRMADVQAGDKNPISLRVAYTLGTPKEEPHIALRPNPDPQQIYLYLHNGGAADRGNFKISVAALGVNGKPGNMLLSGSVAKIAAGKSALIELKPIATLPPPKEGKELPPSLPGLGAPPYKLQIVAEDDTSKKTFVLPVLLQDPSEYTEVTDVQVKNVDGIRKLSVSVGLKDKDSVLPGSGIPVTLNLPTALNPGLLVQKAGTFQGELTAKQKSLDLHADKVEFRTDAAPKSGRIMVNVDGYDRAFQFPATFASGATQRLTTKTPRARILVPRYQLPADALKVPVQIDADLSKDLRVEVAFDSGTGDFTANPLLPSFREQSVQVGAGKEGQFLFNVKVQDWLPSVISKGVFGPRTVRIRLLDRKDTPVKLANEEDVQTLFNRDESNLFAPLSYSKDQTAVFAQVVFDETPPKVVLKMPKRVAAGTDFLPAAEIVRGKNQAIVDKVDFYPGDFVKDDQPLPKNAVAGKRNPKTKAWEPEKPFTVPAGEKERIVVNVRAESVVKLKGSASASVPVGPDDAAKGVTIAGVISRGDRPQPKVDVKLLDAKGAVKKTTTTDAEGKYEFVNIPPGSYFVYAGQPALKVAGYQEVVVPEDKTAKVPAVNVKLSALSK